MQTNNPQLTPTQARGHRVENVPEFPLVIGGGVGAINKTNAALAMLTRFGVDQEVNKSKASRKVRTGAGKMRNRRYVQRLGPVIVHAGESPTLEKAFRNISGVEIAHVDRLNLLRLAPGGHLGRFVIWTQAAFEKLDTIYGTDSTPSSKVDYRLPRHIISNADLNRIINSDEIQSVVKPAQDSSKKKTLRKKNPLNNLGVMVKLNPYALAHRRAEARAQVQRKGKKAALLKAKRASGNTRKERQAFYAKMLAE